MSTASGIEQTHRRILKLIDTSELIVQSTALLDDNAPDARFIHAVRDFARQAQRNSKLPWTAATPQCHAFSIANIKLSREAILNNS